MAREKPVLRANARVERQFGNTVRDQIEIGNFLHILRKQLEEAGVIHRVIIIVPRVHVERVLRDGARRHIEHIGETLAHRRVERLVHVGNPLPAREVRRAQTRHAHTGRHGRRRMLAFRLKEQEPTTVDVHLAFGDRSGPALAHLRARGDRIRAGGFASGRLHRDDGGTAVERFERAGELRSRHHKRRRGFTFTKEFHLLLRCITGTPANCAPFSHAIAPVGHRAAAFGASSAILS